MFTRSGEKVLKIAFPVASIALLTLLILGACTAGKPAATDKNSGIAIAQSSEQVKKQTWEIEWDKALSEAIRESKVVIYTTLGGETTPLLRKAFTDRYNIAVEYIGGTGGEMAQKILTERKAGLYLVDLWQGGNTTLLNSLKPADALEPLEPALILPEVKDTGNWLGGKMEFVDKQRTILPYLAYAAPPIAINTSIVGPEEIKSYKDLLNPKWKGKLTIQDPTMPGFGQNWFAVALELGIGLDYMRELAKQEPVLIRDRRLQVEWLAQGKYPVAIAAQSDILGAFEKEGAPLRKMTLIEGTNRSAGSGNISLIKQAPHPGAARVFLNWVLTAEAQTLHSRANLLPSARVDVSTTGLDPTNIIQPGGRYFNADNEDFILSLPQKRDLAREVFSNLIK